MVLPMLFWLMNSVCPMLYFNLDFTAAIEKRHINKAKLSYKPSNDSAKMAVYFIMSLESWLGSLSRKWTVYADFTFNWSYSAIVWPLIYKITTFTDVILCAKIGFKATTGKQHKFAKFA